MNPEIIREAGFGKEVESVSKGLCPFCQIPVNVEDFRNPKSVSEYKISGLCQKCQDEFFGKD